MGKQGVIGGRGQFSSILRNGRRLSCTHIRASYVLVKRDDGSVRCGISVPRQTGNAVRRNRIRRLIREAVRSRMEDLHRASSQARAGVDVIVQFRSVEAFPIHRISLHLIMPEVEEIFGRIAGRIVQGKP